MISFFYFLLLIAPLYCSEESRPIVNTPLGIIKGIYKSESNDSFYSFNGIPYGKPPTGDLRFKPPVPIEPWEGVFDAETERICCRANYYRNADFTEDCLRLNIYTRPIKSTPDATLWPVLVWLHGGNLIYFTGENVALQLFPHHVMNHNVVLVKVNYRLGPLGFLSTGDTYAPGNYGLKDQVLALKWVKNYIKYFGGDPSRVTLLGNGFGAASVGLHLVSPMSRGLFHGAIMISGSPINFWSIVKNPLDLAKMQAELIGCPINSTEKMIECLSRRDPTLRGRFDRHYITRKNDIDYRNGSKELWYEIYPLYGPVIEPENDGSERFLTKEPIESILEGDIADVPIFIGTTRNEMINEVCNLQIEDQLVDELSGDWNTFAPILLHYPKNDTSTRRIREYYFGSSREKIILKYKKTEECDDLCRILYLTNVDNYHDSKQVFSNLLSDSYFNFGVLRFTKLAAEKNTKPVYYYQFNYFGRNETNKAAHQDDMLYAFDVYEFERMCNSNWSPWRDDFSNKYVKLWINFAEKGNPTPEVSEDLDNVIWKPYTNSHPAYLDINKTFTLKYGIPNKERMNLWESILPLPDRKLGV